MKRIAIALSAVALILGLSLILFFTLLSPAYVAARLAETVRAATGLEVQYASAPGLSFLPLRVRIEDATLSAPSGPAATLPAVEMVISARDLLAKRFAPARIVLENPQFKFAVSPEGQANWSLPQAAGLSGPVPEIEVRGGTVNFVDERSGDSFEAQGIDGIAARGAEDQGLSLSGHFDWHGDRLRLDAFLKRPADAVSSGTSADITAEGARLRFAFSGLARIEQGLTLAGQMEAQVPDLKELARWSGIRVPEGGTVYRLSASGAFESRVGRMLFREASFELNGMSAQGDATLTMLGKRPQLAASLAFQRLDLDNLSGSTPAANAEWSGKPLDLSALNLMDAQLAVSAESLKWQGLETGKATLNAELKGGALTAQLSEAALGSGTAQGKLTLLVEKNEPQLNLSLSSKGADARVFGNALFGTQALTGAADVTLELASHGESPLALIAAASGTANVSLTNGSVENADLAGLADAVSQKIITGWAPVKEARTGVEQLTASFTVADGIAETKDLTLQGSRLKLGAAGRIDFLRRFIEFTSDPQIADAAGGSFTGLPVGLITKGPWDNPKHYPDMPGILENPAQAYAAIKAMGRKSVSTP